MVARAYTSAARPCPRQFVLSGRPALEELYWFADGVLPRLTTPVIVWWRCWRIE